MLDKAKLKKKFFKWSKHYLKKTKTKTNKKHNNNSVQLDEELPPCWSFIVKCINYRLTQNVKCPVLNNQDTQKHYHHQLGNEKSTAILIMYLKTATFFFF